MASVPQRIRASVEFHAYLFAASRRPLDPRDEVWVFCKRALQGFQLLPKDWETEKCFDVRLSDLPDGRWKEAVHFELEEFKD